MPKFHRTMDTPSNRKFSRIAAIGAITMLQGALYLALSIWALLVIECQFDMMSTNLGTIMYFIYFRNSECAEVMWSRTKSEVAELPKVTFVEERTEGLVIFYIALSFLWILTSLFVIVGATRSNLNKTAFHCCFTPWAIVIIAGCLLDVIATIFHIYDSVHTTTPLSTFDYLNVLNIWEVLPSAEKNYSHFYYPSVIFICVSSRLVVFFLFNLIGMIWAVRQAAQLILNRTDSLDSNDRHSPPKGGHGRPQPIDPNQYYYVPTRIPADHLAQPSDLYRRSFEQLKPADNPMEIVVQDLYALPADRKQKRVKMPSNASQMMGSNQPDVVVHRRNDSGQHAHQPQVPEKRHSANARRLPIDVGRSQSDRYPEHERSAGADRSSAPVDRPTSYVTGELRSQLPWSYFNAREDMTAPRKALAHAEDHEVLPPVPVPDYTLHFPKKDRYTIQERVAQLQAAAAPVSTSQNTGMRW